nr:MAG TPA: hypothetical protein [Crassvirales sp.]
MISHTKIMLPFDINKYFTTYNITRQCKIT